MTGDDERRADQMAYLSKSAGDYLVAQGWAKLDRNSGVYYIDRVRDAGDDEHPADDPDERRAEIEAVAQEAIGKLELARELTYAERLVMRVSIETALDRVRRAPGPSSRERDAGTEDLKAELELLRDLRQRVIGFGGDDYTLAPWVDIHRRHRDEPYIGCPFCRDQFVPVADLTAAREQIEWLQEERRRWELRQGPTCHRCGNSWAARDQAEARCSEIRAETIAEVVTLVRRMDDPVPTGAVIHHTAALVADFIERHFAAPPARNDEHGTENEGLVGG